MTDQTVAVEDGGDVAREGHGAGAANAIVVGRAARKDERDGRGEREGGGGSTRGGEARRHAACATSGKASFD
jgi:hypothetical protein